MIQLTDNHAPRLAKMTPDRIMPEFGKVLKGNAQAIVDFARENINDGAISGSGHIPGAPFDFPNSDTHELEQSLHVGDLIETPAEVRTSAIADAPHAVYVERGTSKAYPRPYMEPSAEQQRPHVWGSLIAAFRRLVMR